jgi:hypothetical protein
MFHTKHTVKEIEPKPPNGAARPDGGDDMQILPAKAAGIFRALRQIVGASLLGGVVAGAIAGSAGTVALGAMVLGAEEAGLLLGAVAGAAFLLLKH